MQTPLGHLLSQNRQMSKIKKKGYPHEVELLEPMLDKPVNEAWVKESQIWLDKIEKLRKSGGLDDISNEETFKMLKKWYRYGLENAPTPAIAKLLMDTLKEGLTRSKPSVLLKKHNEAFRLNPTRLLKYIAKYPTLAPELFEFEVFNLSQSLFHTNHMHHVWSQRTIEHFFKTASLKEFEVLLKGFNQTDERDYVGNMLLQKLPNPAFLQLYLDEGYPVASLHRLWTPHDPHNIEVMLTQLMSHTDGPAKIQDLLYVDKHTNSKESLLLPPQWMDLFMTEMSNGSTSASSSTQSKEYYHSYLSSLKEFDPTMLEFKTPLGWTFLHALAFFQKSDWFDLLVAQGLDPLALNQKGQTPREVMEEALGWAKFQRLHGSIEGMDRDETFQVVLESKELSQKLDSAPSKTPKSRL